MNRIICFVGTLDLLSDQIRTYCANDFLRDTESLLKVTLQVCYIRSGSLLISESFLQRICLALPDSLVSPKLWSTYVLLLEEVISESTMKKSGDRYIEQNIRELKHAVLENFLDIKRRNEAMLFRGLTAESSFQLDTAVSCVKVSVKYPSIFRSPFVLKCRQLLNSISSSTIMSSLAYFDADSKALSDFRDKLNILLTWSVTPLQYGDHRPFAAVTLIRLWRNRACDRASRRDTATPTEFLQDQLFDWLDSSEVAGEPSNIGNVALLFGKLVEHDVFSYSGYIQRLIARAEAGLSFTDVRLPSLLPSRIYLT